MRVSLENIGKKFGREWIFRGLNTHFSPETPTVILGANGSGKSTLLQIISGSLMQGEGSLHYEIGEKRIDQDDLFRHVSFAAPYLELMEEFTLAESIHFHGQFKSWRGDAQEKLLLEISGLGHAKNKRLKNFSSGMKMRVRLLLAICSDTPLLLLDEPCSNLDAQAVEWYRQLIGEHTAGRTTIVCSNQLRDEYFFCTKEIRMEDYK
ncbi:MAG TPA: ATP-binding cassette domain-containing protein [Bacteroidia bacterium]|nr:ATP-binding cassette domain-containing protein [Bacteroidia bacterium]